MHSGDRRAKGVVRPGTGAKTSPGRCWPRTPGAVGVLPLQQKLDAAANRRSNSLAGGVETGSIGDRPQTRRRRRASLRVTEQRRSGHPKRNKPNEFA